MASNIVFSADAEGVSMKISALAKAVSRCLSESGASAKVPIIDDTRVEQTESATLNIGINKESARSLITTTKQRSSKIAASSVLEGDGKDLIYSVDLNQAAKQDITIAFLSIRLQRTRHWCTEDTPNVTDYLNGAKVTLSNGVRNNNDGTVTVPAGVKILQLQFLLSMTP